MTAPSPPNEAERVAFLHQTALLQRRHDPWFDEQARAASDVARCPVGLVSIVSEDEQTFVGCVGLGEKGTPRQHAFCAHCIMDEGPLVVPDTHDDPRFAFNALVTNSPFIRFYAGVPLTIRPGLALGSLCVIDRRPREINGGQLRELKRLARAVVKEVIRQSPQPIGTGGRAGSGESGRRRNWLRRSA